MARWVLLLWLGLGAGCVLVVGGPRDWTAETLHGTGVEAVEVRPVGAAERVQVADGIRLHVVVGEAPRLEVRGDDNVLGHVRTEQRDGELRVFLEDGSYRLARPVAVALRTPALRALRVESGAAAEVTGVEGSGVEGAGLLVESFGARRLVVSGAVEVLELELRGGGEVDLAGLECARAEVTATDGGRVRLHAREEVSARLEGGAELRVLGPARVRTSGGAAGSVRRE